MTCNPGEHVMLKSGGPRMTVVEVKGGDAVCEWVDDRGETVRDDFPRACLVPF